MDSADHLVCGLQTCWCQSAFLSATTFCCAISAYSMASISTLQVGSWVPLPSTHLVGPVWTASSSFKGLAVKHAFIVGTSSPTPYRTALAFPAAFLLTCFLKSMRWPVRSVERARPSPYRWWLTSVLHSAISACDSTSCTPHTHLTHTTDTHNGKTSLTSHRWSKLCLHWLWWLRLWSCLWWMRLHSWLWWLRLRSCLWWPRLCSSWLWRVRFRCWFCTGMNETKGLHWLLLWISKLFHHLVRNSARLTSF